MGFIFKWLYRSFMLVVMILAIGVFSIYYKENRSSEAEEAEKTTTIAELLEEGGEVVVPEDVNITRGSPETIINEHTTQQFITNLVENDDANHLGGLAASEFLRSQYDDLVEQQLTFTMAPRGTGIDDAGVYINPATAHQGETLFGVALNGAERFKIDSEGDVNIFSNLDVAGTITTGNLSLNGSSLTSQISLLNTDVSFDSGDTAIIDAINSAYNAATGGGGGLWQLSSGAVNTTTATHDFSVGGSSLTTSIFSIDESTGNFYFGADNSANPTFNFEATDGDAGEFGFNTNDSFYFSNANVGIGTTNAEAKLHAEVSGFNTAIRLSNSTNTSRYLTLTANQDSGYINTDSLLGFAVNNTLEWRMGPSAFESRDGGVILNSSGSISNPAYSFLADQNSGLYYSGTNDNIGLVTGGTERIRIDGSGNVGIGTTSPSSDLDIQSTTGTDLLELTNSTSGLSYSFDVGTTGMTIGGSGGAAFQINDAAQSSTLVVGQNQILVGVNTYIIGNGASADLTLRSNSAGADTKSVLIQGYNGSAWQTALQAPNKTSGFIDLELVPNGGNVGIETTTPLGKLHILGSGDDQQLIVQANSTQTANIQEWQNNAGTVLGSFQADGDFLSQRGLFVNGIYSNDINVYNGTQLDINLTDIQGRVLMGTTGYLHFVDGSNNDLIRFANGGAIFNEQGNDADFRIEGDTNANLFFVDASTDRVGIGTVSPATKLDVSASFINVSAGNGLQFGDSSTSIFGNSSTDVLTLSTNSQSRLRVTADGNVGIGDITPAAHLVVGADTTAGFADGTGDVYIQNDLEVDGTIYGNISGTIDTSLTAGSIVFAGASGELTEDNTNFFWDDTTNEFGLGTTTPGARLDVIGRGGAETAVLIRGGLSQNGDFFQVTDSTGTLEYFSMNPSTGAVLNEIGGPGVDFRVEGDTDANLLFTDASADRVGIGTNSPGYKLDIQSPGAADLILRAIRTGTSRGLTLDAEGKLTLSGGDIGADSYATQLSYTLNRASATGAISNALGITTTISPTSGDTDISALYIASTINQSGTAVGDTKGIYIGDTLTNVTGSYRALEIANNAHYAIYQSGASATNYFAGNVGIGNTTPGAKLDISASPRWDDSTADPAFVIRSSQTSETDKLLRMGFDSIGANDFAFIQAAETGVATKNLILQGQGSSVGIGTVGPDRKLDILDASNPQLRLTQADGTVYADFHVNSGGDLIAGVDGITNQFVLDNGGNVGIGTAAPQSTLNLNGGVGSLSTGLSFGDGDSGIYESIDDTLIFHVFGSEDMALNSNGLMIGSTGGPTSTLNVEGATVIGANYSGTNTPPVNGLLVQGNVGIGTTGPDRKLDILDASNPQLRLTQADGTVYADFQVNSDGDLIAGVDGTTNQFVLDNGGNVGIGDTSPDAKLNILATTEQLRLDYDDSNYVSFTVGSTGALTIDPTNTSNSVAFGTGALVIQGSATPQINATNASIKLQNATFNGTAGTIQPVHIQASFSPSTGTMNLNALDITPTINQTGTATGNYVGLNVNVTETAVLGTDNYFARFGKGGTYYVTINNSGVLTANNVTDADSEINLSEAGTTRWNIFNDGDNTDRLYITDDDNDNGMYIDQDATSWTANSDIRLKENVAKIENVLQKITGVNAYTYNFIGTDKTEVGVIAQEWQNAFPEIVSTGANGYLGISYDRLSPILLQAVQELDVKVDSKFASTESAPQALTVDDEQLKDIYKKIEQEYVAKAELEKHLSFGEKIINIFSEVVFRAKATYQASVEFIADATFRGSIRVNADTAGEITVPANTKKFRVSFTNVFSEQPIVYLDTDDNVEIVEVTTEYFVAQIDPTVNREIKIKWIALLSDKVDPEKLEIIETSEGTTEVEIVEEIVEEVATESATLTATESGEIN